MTELVLRDADAPAEPLELFDKWLNAAIATGMFVPDAMALATVDEHGLPDVRMVLLKGHDPQGFVFYTNYESPKAKALDRPDPNDGGGARATLLFWWRQVQQQVRISGRVQRTELATNQAYFATRPRGSQLGAWASQQSAPVPSRQVLEDRFQNAAQRFEGGEVPCPEFWGGYRLVHDRVEFWQGRDDRLHDRLLYRREGACWTRTRLMP